MHMMRKTGEIGDTMVLTGIFIPFLGTAIGAAAVFLMRRKTARSVECLLNGFAAGVMVAASVWSLLIPCISLSASPQWVNAAVGFAAGVLFLVISERLLGKLNRAEKLPQSALADKLMLIFAVTLHNIPEGMAVGVSFAAALHAGTDASMLAAAILALGIAVQNVPEGAIISLPLKSAGYSKAKAFLCGALSGVVEPIAAALTLALTAVIAKLLPLFLAFAAGAMFYVCVNELIPAAKPKNGASYGIAGFSVGFLLMMILDVALG